MIFLGSPRTKPAAAAHESGRWMRAPMLALAAVCVALALAPVLVWRAVVVRRGASGIPCGSRRQFRRPLISLGTAQVALMLLAVAAAVCARCARCARTACDAG